MKCKVCELDKGENDFHYNYYIKKDGTKVKNQNGPCKKCKSEGKTIGKRKSSIFIDDKRLCKNCNELKTLDNYYYNNAVPVGNCKTCRSQLQKKYYVPRRKEKIKDIDNNDEIFRFIWLIRARNYKVEVLDFWRIIHYSQILWPNYKENDEPFITEITKKWKKLESWYVQH